MTTTNGSPIDLSRRDGDSLWLLRLCRPKANVIDAAMTAALHDAFALAKEQASLRAIVLAAEGPHFSFGASVQEHQREQVGRMLHAFHGLFRSIAACGVPVLAAVRGQCLGGGLELASFCQRVFAAPDSRLGQPEIALGVFAPVASLLLPHRVGRAAAEDLCLSGRSLGAEDALRIGLVDELVDDPEAAALRYAQEHLLRHSASSLRHALRAVRGGFLAQFFHDLDRLERSYTTDLVATHDANEGIEAFVAKRPPQWRHA